MEWDVLETTSSVRLTNLPTGIDKEAIEDFLSPFVGEIERILLQNTIADVILSTTEDVQSMLKLDGTILQGNKIGIAKCSDEQIKEAQLLDKELEIDETNIEVLEETSEGGKIIELKEFYIVKSESKGSRSGSDSFFFTATHLLEVTTVALIALTIISFF
jgi:hypothetical protein